jgi:hypothetical protein
MPDDPRLNGAGAQLDAHGRAVLRNEFAIVNVSIVGRGRHQRLRIEDQRAQVSVELDPLELECLAWARHRDLAPLLDPNATRWPSGQTDGDGA